MNKIFITLFLILSILISPAYAQIDVPTEDAVAIGIADAGGYFTGTEVEAALQEIGAGTAIDHGLLQGLTDDDHPHYGEIAQTESITGLWNFIASGVGGLGNYDITIGDVVTPDYGIMRIGDALMGRTSYNVANLDLDGAVIFRNMGTPATSNIEFVWTESGGSAIRFALAMSGTGNATYNPRSMIIAGPAVNNDEIVTVGYWQSQGIFHNLVMDTGGVGADLGVQNDLEVERHIFTHGNFLLQSATDSTTAFQVKDNAGNVVLDVDTVGEMVGIGTDAPKSQLGIAGTTPIIWLFDTGNMAYWGFGGVGGGFSMFESNASGSIVEKFISLWLGGGNAYVAINEGKQDINFTYSGDTTDDIIVFDAGTESLDFLDNVPIKMGTGKDAEIYYNNTNLIIDPDAVGTGKVLIGATGDNDLKANVIEATELFNSAGALKIQPDVEGNVVFFVDTDVGATTDGGYLVIHRKAAEGDRLFTLGINEFQSAFFYSDANMIFRTAASRNIRFDSADDISLELGDAAGVNHLYVKDSALGIVVDIDSDGNMQMDGNLTIGAGAAGVDYRLLFDGDSNDGIIDWLEASDLFLYSDNILMSGTKAVGFRDAAIRIRSATDGHLDLDADVSIDLNGNTGVGISIAGDSLFEVDGAEGLAIETVTGNTTLDATHSTVLANCSGNCTMTLPTAASSYNNTDGIGRIYEVKKIDADADTVTIDGNGSELVENVESITLTVQFESVTLQSNGTGYWIL